MFASGHAYVDWVGVFFYFHVFDEAGWYSDVHGSVFVFYCGFFCV